MLDWLHEQDVVRVIPKLINGEHDWFIFPVVNCHDYYREIRESTNDYYRLETAWPAIYVTIGCYDSQDNAIKALLGGGTGQRMYRHYVVSKDEVVRFWKTFERERVKKALYA